ncbi:hypothetical protein SK128_011965 [Halocaridina rubra]|uniref:Uncharacterized protein n=1 Tax=Halocaridina rubra TaxID=373956 RepID=A0AAN9A185_HALRR
MWLQYITLKGFSKSVRSSKTIIKKKENELTMLILVRFLKQCTPRILYYKLARHTQMDFINASDVVLCMARIPYGILVIHRTTSDAFMKSICEDRL